MRSWFLAAAVAAVVAAPVGAQTGFVDPEFKPIMKEYPFPEAARTNINLMKNGRRTVSGPDAEKNKEMLADLARHYVYLVTQPKYYLQTSETGELVPRNPNNSLDSAFDQMKTFLPVYKPDSKISVDQAEYVKEVGAAFNTEIVALMKKNLPAVVRTNLVRLLTIVARIGAADLAPTITNLIADPKTPPEALFHAYKAAEAFLAAYDATAVGGSDAYRHAVRGEPLVNLVRALESHVVPGPPVAELAALDQPTKSTDAVTAPRVGGRLENQTLTPEQIDVVRFFRRAAVRALGRVRYDTIGTNATGEPILRPGFTLAKVATNDATLYPAASVPEIAEAVIGLTNLTAGRELAVDELLIAIATGVDIVARVKVVNPIDKTLPWRMFAARLALGLETLNGSVNRSPNALKSQAKIKSLSDLLNKEIVKPLDTGTAAPNVDRVEDWIANNAGGDPKRKFYDDTDRYKLTPRKAKN